MPFEENFCHSHVYTSPTVCMKKYTLSCKTLAKSPTVVWKNIHGSDCLYEEIYVALKDVGHESDCVYGKI